MKNKTNNLLYLVDSYKGMQANNRQINQTGIQTHVLLQTTTTQRGKQMQLKQQQAQ